MNRIVSFILTFCFLMNSSFAVVLTTKDGVPIRDIDSYIKEGGKYVRVDFDQEEYAGYTFPSEEEISEGNLNLDLEFQKTLSFEKRDTGNIDFSGGLGQAIAFSIHDLLTSSGTKLSAKQIAERNEQRRNVRNIDIINENFPKLVAHINAVKRHYSSISARSRELVRIQEEIFRIKDANYSKTKKRTLLRLQRMKLDADEFEGDLKEAFELTRYKYQLLEEKNLTQEEDYVFIDIGISSYREAKEEYKKGNKETSLRLLGLSDTFLDIGLGLVPFVGSFKDAYDAFHGFDLINKKELSDEDRLISTISFGVGLLSFGVGSVGVKSLGKLIPFARKNFDKITSFLDSAGKLAKDTTSEGMSFFLNKFKSFTQKGASGADDAWAKFSGIIRDAKKGKGNFGLGKATSGESIEAGKAWVGKHYIEKANGAILVSKDKLRQFRLPSYKQGLGKTQANFEWRNKTTGQYQGNGHLDIVK